MIAPGSGLQFADVPEPRLRAGAARVTVLAAHVPAYTDVLVAGNRGGFPTPVVLGPSALVRVEEVADDVFGVRAGDVAIAGELFRTGRTDETQEVIPYWTGSNGDEASAERIRGVWRDGFFAERAVVPERLLTALPGAEPYRSLAFLPWLAIAGEAVDRADVRAGHRVGVVGATGQLGTSATLVALARGAATVVVGGRNRAMLDRLAALDRRVVPVPFTGSREADAAALRTAGRLDVVVDALGAVPDAETSMAGLDAVGVDGTWVAVGGVRHRLPIDYGDLVHRRLTLRGSWMVGPRTLGELWRQVAAGVLDLSVLDVRTVGLPDPATALRTAAERNGLDVVLLVP